MFDCVFTYRENTLECSKSREYLVNFEPGFMFTSWILQINKKLNKKKKEKKRNYVKKNLFDVDN